MLQLFQTLFDRIGVNSTVPYLKRAISSEPNKNSLFGVSIILSQYNVGNVCVKFEDKTDLSDTECPCIIIYDGEYTIVETVNEDTVRLYSEGKGERTCPKSDFFQDWNGVAMLLQPDEHSCEPHYGEHRNALQKARFKMLSFIGVIAMMFFAAILTNPLVETWSWWAALIVNIAGMAVAFMLLQKQLHIPNRFADKLCGLAKESHCEDVTNSEGGELFGLVKLSEVGGGFFFVNTMALLFFVPASIYFLALISVCVLPFTFWSVWYQKFKAKSWCVLCLCTLALMWLQAIVYFAGGTFGMVSHQWITALYLIAGYATAVLALNRLMSVLENGRNGERWHTEYNRLKANDSVIKAFESDADRFATDQEHCSSLVFGNPDAANQITILSNPYCGPCAKMHERIQNLPGNAVSIKYAFAYFASRGDRINRYMIAAYQQLGARRTWDLMTDWYCGGKIRGEAFFDGLGIDPDTEAVEAELDKHARWRQDDRLYGTPTVLINGREIVYPYVVEDYMYIAQV